MASLSGNVQSQGLGAMSSALAREVERLGPTTGSTHSRQNGR
jgi:hypothetical protein